MQPEMRVRVEVEGTGGSPNPPLIFNLVFRQTFQSCAACGIWFDPQGNPGDRPRLVVRYNHKGSEQSQTFQYGKSHPLYAYFLAPPAQAGPRSEHEHSLLVKKAPARTGLVFADLSVIPPQAKILQARLHLHIDTKEGLSNNDKTSVLTVYTGLRKWDFKTVDWNQWTTGKLWKTPGGDSGAVVRKLEAGPDFWARGFNKANPNAHFDFTPHVVSLQAKR